MTGNNGKRAEKSGAGTWRDWVHSALREVQDTLRRPLYWAIVATAVTLTVVAGPFGTLDGMTMPVRAFFWGVGIPVTGLVMTVLIVGSRHFNADRRYPWTLVSIAAALIGVPPTFALFYGLVSAVSPYGPPRYPLRLLTELTTILVLISIVGNARIYLRRTPAATAAEPAPAPAPMPVDAGPALPLLLEKLPNELGQELVCLRAQDHYVEAVTPLGRATILMRLSDAERDLVGFDGLRVHRSWWVNLDHVVSLARTEAGGMELTTSTGITIPVARGQRATVKAALDQRREAAE